MVITSIMTTFIKKYKNKAIKNINTNNRAVKISVKYEYHLVFYKMAKVVEITKIRKDNKHQEINKYAKCLHESQKGTGKMA